MDIFAEQKDKNMCASDEKYELLERLLNEEKVYLDRTLSFARICSWLGVRRKEMDDLLINELGMDGESILARLRRQEPNRLMSKYGINCFF